MKYQSEYDAPYADTKHGIIKVNTGAWRYQRPVCKTAKCAQCGTCYLVCPLGVVKDKGTHYEADLDYCKGCGMCARYCPVNAIAMVREV